MDKAKLRQSCRISRRNIAEEIRHTAPEKITNIFSQQACCQTASNIALYLATGYELGTQNLIHQLWSLNKSVYVPVLNERNGAANLAFAGYVEHDELIVNQHNILEPKFDESLCLDPKLLDIVLLPLLAFDAKGYRLGSGGGYYDRTFLPLKNSGKMPLLVGIAFDEQAVESLPHDVWDVPLNAILTPTHFKFF